MTRHYVLTMTGSAQLLSSVLDGAGGGPNDLPVRWLSLQAFGTNAAAAYIGGSATGAPTSSVYGQRIEAAAAGVPPAPSVMEFGPLVPVRLSDFYVIGANGEKLTILVVH